jgi:dethiobiotin synthetase
VTLVIVGTGTDVGKTVVAATLLARYGAEVPLAYWKPVATGARDGRDTATVEALAGDRAAILAESYLFDEPVSPHLAARLAGRRIEPAALLADFDRHRAGARTLVIETAGGLLVPLVESDGDGDGGPGDSGPAGQPGGGSGMSEAGRGGSARAPGARGGSAGDTRGWPFRQPPEASSPSHSPSHAPSPSAPASSRQPSSPPPSSPPPASSPSLPAWHSGFAGAAAADGAATAAAGAGYLQADLIVDMARRAPLSCLVVARTTLGTINHTLLTLEALRARGLGIAGVVLDGPPNRENRRAIERFGGVETILELPHLAPLDREEVAAAVRHFDRGGLLAPLLRLRRQVPAQGDRPGYGGSRGSRGLGGRGGGGESGGGGDRSGGSQGSDRGRRRGPLA